MYTTVIGTDLAKAKQLLEEGELVAIPTETVYGLAANGLNTKAIAKIYAAKNRPQFNPLILHVANLSQLEEWVENIPVACLHLIKEFSPGPITYLLPKSFIVPDIITAGSNKVAIRIPSHPLTLQLLSSLNFPIAAPSANPSGYVSPVTSKHVLDGLNGLIPYIIEGGSCSIGLESTIVGFEENKVIVHRLGGLSIEDIQRSSGVDVEVRLSHASPTAPGQLQSHYATKKPLIVGDIKKNLLLYKDKKIGLLSFSSSYMINGCIEHVLSPNGNIAEAASRLFNAMRLLDLSDVEVILAEVFPNEGLGKAINDRLARASYPMKK